MNKYTPIQEVYQALLIQKGTGSISLAAFDKLEPEYQALNTGKKVIIAFKKMVAKFLEKYEKLNNNHDLRMIEYTNDFKPDPNFIEFLKIKGSHFESVVSSVPNPSDSKIFDPDDIRYVNRLKFYVLIFTIDSKRVLIFKRYTQSKELAREGRLIISLIGDQYEKLGDSVFSFDEKFDCMAIDDTLYIFNVVNTEIIFQYYNTLKTSAFNVIDTIAAHIPIANLDDFKADCSTHLQKLAKLENIAKKGYLPYLTMNKIKQLISEFHLHIKIVTIDGQEMLEHDRENKWALLTLLDDGFLSSHLTGINYEVNSKLVLPATPAKTTKM